MPYMGSLESKGYIGQIRTKITKTKECSV